MSDKLDNIMTELSIALSDLHLLGYEEGYNDKTIEICKIHKEGNNQLLRQEAINQYLLGLKIKKSFEKRTESAIRRITELIFEGIQETKEE
ncbi:MAG TPA: hypothetical protein ENG48_00260 [Candidatus Atribacteria bacterium]|nr:hypothetical protein [Candidatus Atribacteria bacterium]